MEIIEEALKSIISRLDKLEFQNSKLSIPDNQGFFPEVKNSNSATNGQVNYIKGLGGQAHKGITKQEAGRLIDELLKDKKILEEQKIEGKKAEEQTIEPIQIKLTKKEIKELGEDAFI